MNFEQTSMSSIQTTEKTVEGVDLAPKSQSCSAIDSLTQFNLMPTCSVHNMDSGQAIIYMVGSLSCQLDHVWQSFLDRFCSIVDVMRDLSLAMLSK